MPSMSYFHLIPKELIGNIIQYCIDSHAENLFDLIASYPDLKDSVIKEFLINEEYYITFKTINEYLTSKNNYISLENIFTTLLHFVVEYYDTSDKDNFVKKLSEFGKSNWHEFDEIEDNSLLDIIIYFKFYSEYPSVLKYYHINLIKYDWLSLRNLYQAIKELLYDEYRLINTNGLSEIEIIDILNLMEKDNSDFSISEISLSQNDWQELEQDEEYNKLVKFLKENNIQIVKKLNYSNI